MAKIIKRVEPKTVQAKYICGCDSIIEFSPSDIRPDQRDGAYVVCPVCGAFIAAAKVFLPPVDF